MQALEVHALVGGRLEPRRQPLRKPRFGMPITVQQIASLGLSVPGFHSLASGFLFGMSLWHSFVAGPLTFKTVPRETFGQVQGRLFPVYFSLQAALSAALLASWIHLHPSVASPNLWEGLADTSSWDAVNAWFLIAGLVSSTLNAVFIGPWTKSIMKQRHKLERSQGKAKEGAPPLPEVKSISKKFGIAHGVSSLLNLGFVLALFSHQAYLGRARQLCLLQPTCARQAACVALEMPKVTSQDGLIPGLVNSNSSCYFNSSLQLLAASSYLHNTLPVPDSDSGCASHTSPTLQCLLDNPYPPDLPFTAAFSALLLKLWSGKTQGAVAAKSLQSLLANKNPDYDGTSQQDAHEVLLNLLDQMRLEEVDLIKKIQPPIKKPARKKRTKPRTSSASETETEDESSTSSEGEVIDEPAGVSDRPAFTPFIDSLFGGRLASFIVCDTCQHVSLTSEPFVDISLAISADSTSKVRKRDRLRSLLVKSPPEIDPHPPKGSGYPSSASEMDGEDDVRFPRSLTTDRPASDGATVDRRRSLNFNNSSRRRSFWGSSSGRSSKSQNASPDRSAERSLSRSPSASRKAKVSPEQALYVKSVLAEVPSPTHPSPLDLLRVAQPPHLRSGASSPTGHPPKEDDKVSGLYTALQRFTAVEVLENDNVFQCRRCWKRAHPEFARPKRRAQPFHPTHSPLAQTAGLPQAPVPQSPLVVDERVSAPVPDTKETSLPPSTIDSMASLKLSKDKDTPTKDKHSKELLPSITIETSSSSNGPGSPTASLTQSAYFASSDRESPDNTDDENAHPVPRPLGRRRPPKAERFIARRALKRFLIAHLPPMLLIHFNRFQQTKGSIFSSFSNLKKVDDFVSFPLILDMAPFLAPLGKPPKEGEERREIHHSLLPRFWGSHKLQHPDERLKHSKYQLSAVVVHNGTMGSGHYICFVRAGKSKVVRRATSFPEKLSADEPVDLADSTMSLPASPLASPPRDKPTKLPDPKEAPKDDGWLYCSDETVRPATTGEVLNSKAYILLYEQLR